MIIGLDAFGLDDAFDTFNIVSKFYRVELGNSIVDEFQIWEDTNLDIYDHLKKEWDYLTLFLAKFQNNLEAGNINLNGNPIRYLRIRKRKEEDLTWDNIIDIPFNKDVKNYNYIDKYIESLQGYEYALMPIGESGVMGNNIVKYIEADFDGVWLCNKDKQYQLIYNLDVGDYETVIPSSVLETIGSQFPIVQTSKIKYRRGNLKCMLVSDSTVQNGTIDRKQEKLNRKNIMNFLTDNRPKFFKESSGENMIVMIINNPKLTPNNTLNQKMYDVSIEFVEIANADTKGLRDNGLL